MRYRTNRFVLENLGLPVITDIQTFAQYIGLNPSLLYILSQEGNERYYRRFTIPKKDGTPRTIYEPSYSMKIVQRWILEEILYKIPSSKYAYGFRKGTSVPLRKNAEAHKDNLFIFKIDLKDFFPSIDSDRIYYLFSQIGYNVTIANMLKNTCTIDGLLPQGAVTSPCLANLVSAHLDKRIGKYCDKREIIYTRYADDLTFSSNDKTLLKSIYGTLKKIITDEGFQINEKKTCLMTPKGRKSITGITVNNKEIKAPKQMKQNVRAMIHKAIVTGDYGEAEKIKGYIAYIASIENDYLPKIKRYIQDFSNNPVCIFSEVVEAYNKNNFFANMPDFVLLQSDNFANWEDVYNFEACQYEERVFYLEKHGIISAANT